MNEKTALQREAKMLNIKEKEVERTEGFLRKIGRKTITGI